MKLGGRCGGVLSAGKNWRGGVAGRSDRYTVCTCIKFSKNRLKLNNKNNEGASFTSKVDIFLKPCKMFKTRGGKTYIAGINSAVRP